MNGKERIEALIDGKKPDCVPAGFWLHFPKGHEHGDEAVRIHLEFHRQTQSDICKIMNENFLTQGFFVNDCSDWDRVKPFDKTAPFIREQIDLVKRIAEQINGQSFISVTLFDTATNLSHILRNGNQYRREYILQTEHLRENQKGMQSAIDAVTEIECYLAEQCLKAGADGIYFAAQDRKKYGYTAEEFVKYIKPSNQAILDAAGNGKNILHICGKNVDLSEFIDYNSQIVNWSARGNNPSLAKGRSLFQGRVLLGGLDNEEGPLYNGTQMQLEEEISDVITAVGNDNFILGADCTLKENTEYARINMAVQAAHNYK